LLCGQTPFSGPPSVVQYHVVHTPPVPPRQANPDVPRDLELICLKTMAKRPEDRYPDCRALVEDLRRWLNGETPSVVRLTPRERLVRWCRREPKLAAAVSVALLAIVGAAVLSLGFAFAQARLRREADQNRAVAVLKEQEAEANAQEAKEHARQTQGA